MELLVTVKEAKAIKALKRVAKIWPDSLWLFSANGDLCVMQKNSEGHHVIIPNGSPCGGGGGMNPDYIIDTINIENDGGDW